MPRIRELTDNLFFTADNATLSNKIQEYIDAVECTLCGGSGFTPTRSADIIRWDRINFGQWEIYYVNRHRENYTIRGRRGSRPSQNTVKGVHPK